MGSDLYVLREQRNNEDIDYDYHTVSYQLSWYFNIILKRSKAYYIATTC